VALDSSKGKGENEMNEKPSGAELFAAFMRPSDTKPQVAVMSLRNIKYQVRKVRSNKKTPEQWRNLPMQVDEIAVRIRDYARGMEFARDVKLPAEKLLLGICDRQWDLLEIQEEQAEYLRKINSVVTLIGVLIVLSIIGSCLLILFGGRAVF